MADAFVEFEILVDSTPEDFGNWLISESLTLFEKQFLGEENCRMFMYNPSIHLPSDDWPQVRFSLDANVIFYVELEENKITKDEWNYEGVIILDIRKLNRNRIHVLGYWTLAYGIKPLERLKKIIFDIFSPEVIYDADESQQNITDETLENRARRLSVTRGRLEDFINIEKLISDGLPYGPIAERIQKSEDTIKSNVTKMHSYGPTEFPATYRRRQQNKAKRHKNQPKLN